jgi:hypothetical protein
MRELQNNADMKKFFADTEPKGSIGFIYIFDIDNKVIADPKDAFFGGRTCVHKVFAKATDEMEIVYMDIISLYPYINFSLDYPVKTPEIIRPDNTHVYWTLPQQIEHEGLYKVRVVPPKALFLPVLPQRVNKADPRLMFMLCDKCSNKKSKDGPVVRGPIECNHNDEKRGWTRYNKLNLEK